jgi:hypothetical protein
MHPFASAAGQEKAAPRMAAQMMSDFIEILQKMSRCNNRAGRNWFHTDVIIRGETWSPRGSGARPAPMQTIVTPTSEATLDRRRPKLF